MSGITQWIQLCKAKQVIIMQKLNWRARDERITLFLPRLQYHQPKSANLTSFLTARREVNRFQHTLKSHQDLHFSRYYLDDTQIMSMELCHT